MFSYITKGTLPTLSIAFVLMGAGISTLAQVSPAGENLYCGPGNTPSFGTTDGPATLPQSCYYTALSGTISGGNVYTATSTSGLIKLLSTAQCGDVIQLTAGSTFGMFTVPAKSCDANHYITIRTSSPDSSLPAEGTRITPCYAGVVSLPGRPAYSCPDSTNVMAKISTSTKGRDIGFTSGANYYRFIGLELTRDAGTGTVSTLVSTSGANNVIFDRVWAHGTATDTTSVGFSLDTSSFVAIIDSYLNDFHCPSSPSCLDSKGISGGHADTTPEGTWKIVNNFVEGAAEDVGFGTAGLISVFASSKDQRVGDMVAGTVVVREREAEAPAFAQVFASPVSDPALRRSFKPVAFTADVNSLTESEIEVVETFLRRRWDLADVPRQWMAWRVAMPLLYKLRPEYDRSTFTYEGFLEELLHRFREHHRFSE